MDALDALVTRRSVRKYKPDPVPQDLLVKIVDAGRLAPTAHNDQAWEFVVITDEQRRHQLADLADYGKFIADAPACIVVLSEPTRYYLEDGSAATTNIMLAATALGLGSCWVAGDKKQYAPQIVSLCGAPENYKLVSMIAIGYPAAIPAPKKRSVDDVLHWESFRGGS
ncbi:MAG: nitroreductase family protein [Planctomycetota bacterium]|nr:MAG: nitroreductase family protein [Planctomycetota bacterium]